MKNGVSPGGGRGIAMRCSSHTTSSPPQETDWQTVCRPNTCVVVFAVVVSASTDIHLFKLTYKVIVIVKTHDINSVTCFLAKQLTFSHAATQAAEALQTWAVQLSTVHWQTRQRVCFVLVCFWPTEGSLCVEMVFTSLPGIPLYPNKGLPKADIL